MGGSLIGGAVSVNSKTSGFFSCSIDDSSKDLSSLNIFILYLIFSSTFNSISAKLYF